MALTAFHFLLRSHNIDKRFCAKMLCLLNIQIPKFSNILLGQVSQRFLTVLRQDSLKHDRLLLSTTGWVISIVIVALVILYPRRCPNQYLEFPITMHPQKASR